MIGFIVVCTLSGATAVAVVIGLLRDLHRQRKWQDTHKPPPEDARTYSTAAAPRPLTHAEFRAKCIRDSREGKLVCSCCGAQRSSLALHMPEQVWICKDRDVCRQMMIFKSQLESMT